MQKSLVERFDSPFMGSFVVAWVLWNYRFIVILFSDNTVLTTFQLIEDVAFPDFWTTTRRAIIFPALTSAVYIFAWPYPSRWISAFVSRRQKELNDMRRKISEDELLSVEESRKLKSDFRKIEGSYYEALDRKDREIARLREELEDLQQATPVSSEKQELSPVSTGTPKTISLDQWKLLARISEAGQADANDVIAHRKDKVQAEFDLGELEARSLVRSSDTFDSRILTVTHEGRRVLLTQKRFSKYGQPLDADKR
jgi:hypothetical protein